MHDIKLHFRTEKNTDLTTRELINRATSVVSELDYRILNRTEDSLSFDDALSTKRTEFTGRVQAFKRIDEGKLEIITNSNDTTLRLTYSVSCILDLLFLIFPIITAIMVDYRAFLGVGLFAVQSIMRIAFIKGSSRIMLIETVKKEAGA